jgi:hypothetical protein
MRWITVSAVLCVGASSWSAPFTHVMNTNQTIDFVNVATNGGGTVNNPGISSNSLAVTPTGQLYAAQSTGTLWNVTGPAIPAGGLGRFQVADLDYAAGGLWGFDNATKELFFFDLGLSTVTYAQVIAVPSALTFTGVAHHQPTGNIYLSGYNGLNNDFLMMVPTMGVAAVPVGSMAHTDGFSFISDIDFDASGNLIAMTWFHRHFYQVNIGTGATSLISVGPHRDTTGMALNPVPEPATAAVFVLGLLYRLRRQRR